MAYQLDHRSQGATPHVVVPTWYSGAGVSWSVEFVVEIFSLSSILRLGGHTNGNMMFQVNTNGAVTAYNAGTSAVITSTAGAAIVGVNTIKVESNGTQWTLTVNGDVKTASSTAALSQMTYMAVRRGSVYASTELAIRSITTVGGTYSTSWDTTNAPSTGTSWTSSGGQVGTLTDFNGTTDSWWVFYSAGGGTVSASVSYDIGAVDYAATSTVTTPNITAALSYDIGAIDYAVTSTVTVAGNAASASFDIGDINYSASATVGVSSSAAYSIGDITYNASALASVTASAAYDIGSVEFTASASVVGDVSAAIGYDVGSVSFSVLMSVPTGEPERSLTTVNNPSWRDSIFFKQFRRH